MADRPEASWSLTVPAVLIGRGARTDRRPADDPAYYLEERFATRPRSARSLTLFYRLKPLIPRRLQIARPPRAARAGCGDGTRVEGSFPRWPIEPVLVDAAGGCSCGSGCGAPPASACRCSVSGPTATGSPTCSPTMSRAPRGLARHRAAARDRGPPRHGVRLVPRRRRLSRRASAARPPCERPAARSACMASTTTAGCSRAASASSGSCRRSIAICASGAPRASARRARTGTSGWMPELGSQLRLLVPRHRSRSTPSPAAAARSCRTSSATSSSCRSRSRTTSRCSSCCASRTSRVWREKAAWIAAHGGPRQRPRAPGLCAAPPERLRHYDELLGFLAALDGGWHALPRDVAAGGGGAPRSRRSSAVKGALRDEAPAERCPAALAAEERDGSIVIPRVRKSMHTL